MEEVWGLGLLGSRGVGNLGCGVKQIQGSRGCGVFECWGCGGLGELRV